MTEPKGKAVYFTTGEVEWAGQTVTEGHGAIVFGRDDAGSLYFKILPHGCMARLPNGREVVEWLDQFISKE